MGRSCWLLSALFAAALFFGIVNIGIGSVFTSHSAKHGALLAPARSDSKSNDATSPQSRPPLDSILHGKWNITGDPSWLLHFAIIGFPKCGTSTMMHHLGQHEQVSIFADERCDLAYNQQAMLIRDSYNHLAKEKTRGMKCPMLLESTQLGMRNMQKYFYKTNYIVGIRHPVLWFESFYNFRIQNEFPMPPPNQLFGKCTKGGYNVCTFRSSFHLFLSNLNMTPMDSNELAYIDSDYHKAMDTLPVSASRPNVFLYELSQLTSRNDAAGELDLRRALQSFLGLSLPIKPFIWVKPGVEHKNATTKQHIDARKIDICDNQYNGLRETLQTQATNVSLWIRRHFLHAPGVFVSNKQRFHEIMEGWEKDPCLQRRLRKEHKLG